jgi:hypothetical protein
MRQGNRVRVLIVPRLVLGGLLVLLGIALTLDQLGVVEVHHVWRYWPAALILIGLSGLQRSEGRRLVTPVILIVVGSWLLLNTLGLVRVDVWDFFWPLILVAVGARIMLRRNDPINKQDAFLGTPPSMPPGAPPAAGTPPGFDRPSGFERPTGFERPPGFDSSGVAPPPTGATPAAPADFAASPASATSPGEAPSGAGGFAAGGGPTNDPEHASLFALLGSSKRRWGRFPFRSAETTAMLGGCELDLRDALMGSTGTAVVEVFVLMGGVEIMVPPNWTVSLEVAPILGGAEDSTRTMPSMSAHKLIVRGTVVMGGIEISN